ncbi:MAG: outer membrane protein assembly factor BamD [Flammeovirgaceae bacterium]|jgi:outer membrane protein assembly factor BamD|nr:outer membrane protein assembly factor BamD [Flammeovirgaceae bacterium]|tara:strand:- start:16302 stop:17129 length:828 start_codon:yes stop_codon:yes gene_type:complete
MMKLSKGIYFILVASVFSVGCTKYQKLLKSADWTPKYEAAMKYYENKDYARAIGLFDDILPIIRGTKEAEVANFYYAYAHFYQDLFILSAHHFQTFEGIYSRSEYALEAKYMFGYSLYKQSPVYSLDQTPSYEAISVLQDFINEYPQSAFANDATSIINELQLKIELKEFEAAKLYAKVRQYEAASVTLENFIRDFPGSDLQEEAFFLRIKMAHDYARASIQSVQSDRFMLCVDRYIAFLDKYPNSKFLVEAEEYYSNSTDFLYKFAEKNNKENG